MSRELALAIGDRIKLYRLNQDLTQEQLASLAKLSKTAVQSAEKGKSQLETYIAIMQALGRVDSFMAAFPDDGESPIQRLNSTTGRKRRSSGKKQIQQPDADDLGW